MPMMKVGDLVLKSTEYLRGKGIDSPRLDAELLLCRILNYDRLRLYMEWQKPLTDLEVSGYREFIRRRGQEREPVARIVGEKEFHGRPFHVTKDTFVPRPETEGLVERALMLLEKETPLKEQRGAVFEVGTGTGCISVTLAAESDHHHFIATDISKGALETARRNAHRHGVDGRIEFRHTAGLGDYRGSLILLVSNPPYIRSSEIPTLQPEVSRHDPMAALDGGADGLDCLRVILREATPLLIPGAWAAFELGEEQPHDAAELFRATGHYSETHVEKDLAGRDRYLLARRGAD